MRARVEPLASALLTSRGLRAVRRAAAALPRRLKGVPPVVHYFHAAGDPWSHLAVQLLPALQAQHGVRIVAHLVPAPGPAVAPDAARLARWSLHDAHRLAAAHGLAFPPGATQPEPGAIAAAEAALAAALPAAGFAARATAIGTALWSGGNPAGPATSPAAALAEGAAALLRAGHYLPGLFVFEGEGYWGVDRLPHLDARLAALSGATTPMVRQLEAGGLSGDAGGAELHFFLSLRSPYTHLAAARVRLLAERWNARLLLRPVLPMVMRGLPVPWRKRRYIVHDAAREAERLGLGFGRIRDPVGAGVERGLAVLHRAMALGRGPAFAESFLSGAFAEGIDATASHGLRRLAWRAGLTDADVAAALADESWRATAEANRQELLALGLWGVPAFRVGTSAAHWGQDRLWTVEADLAAVAQRPA